MSAWKKFPPRTQEPNDMNRDEIEKAIELAATTPTDSVRYSCPICKGDQYKEDKEFHKK